MTIKVDGTNGVLQTYDFQVLTTGFTYTFAAGTTTLIADPAGTLATGTITMPAAPADGMVITIQSTQQITALTIQGNTGQSLVGGTMTMRANQPESFVYRLTNTTWYPFAGATNTQIVSGTAVASSSGTSIDFTGIPSWVKRVTVMFVNVSTNGSSNYLVRVGNGSVVSTGYVSTMTYVNIGANSCTGTTDTTGYIVTKDTGAGVSFTGVMTINLQYNSVYVAGFNAMSNGGPTYQGAGYISLGSVLDRVRITTINGTDTFDGGTINIFYE
jgi:hypothetical protein